MQDNENVTLLGKQSISTTIYDTDNSGVNILPTDNLSGRT